MIRFPLSPTELRIQVALCNPLCYGVFVQGLPVSPTKLGTYVVLYIEYKSNWIKTIFSRVSDSFATYSVFYNIPMR